MAMGIALEECPTVPNPRGGTVGHLITLKL